MGAFCSCTFISCWPQTRLPLCAFTIFLQYQGRGEKNDKNEQLKTRQTIPPKKAAVERSTYKHGPKKKKTKRGWDKTTAPVVRTKKKEKDEPSLSPPAGSHSICSLIMTWSAVSWSFSIIKKSNYFGWNLSFILKHVHMSQKVRDCLLLGLL